MNAITRGAHPKALWPGVHKFGMGIYKSFPWEYTDIFDVKSSNMAYEEMVEVQGFRAAQEKAEGAAVAFDSQKQGFVNRWTHITYALGYAVTQEEREDNLYMKAFPRAEQLARSFRITKEVVGADVLNNGHSGSFLGPDGVALYSTAHPTNDGTQSNKLTVAADLAESSLEDILIDISEAKDTNGLQAPIMAQCLIIPPALVYEATRILRSELRVGTDHNDINAMRNLGVLPGGHKVNHFLTDSDSWHVKTDCPEGLTWFDRIPYTFSTDNDFDTGNLLHKGRERYSTGWLDWRTIYGSEGAG